MFFLISNYINQRRIVLVFVGNKSYIWIKCIFHRMLLNHKRNVNLVIFINEVFVLCQSNYCLWGSCIVFIKLLHVRFLHCINQIITCEVLVLNQSIVTYEVLPLYQLNYYLWYFSALTLKLLLMRFLKCLNKVWNIISEFFLYKL